MKNKILLKIKYEAFGFAEALMAIMITGIAATVLMSISASSMRQLMQIEDMDTMAQLARSGAVTAQKIADNDSTLGEAEVKVFGNVNVAEDHCFIFNGETIDTGTFLTIGDRDTLRETAVFTEDPYQDFFRYICIDGIDTDGVETKRLVVKIVAGLIKSKGDFTNSSDTKDYEYISIIDL